METLYRANAFVGKHFPWFSLGCVMLGLLFPDFFSPLNHITVALFAFMTFTSSLGGGFREMRDVFLHPLPALTILFLLHIVMPLTALGLGTLLFPDAPLFTTGLVLEYTVPSAVASLMWVGMGGGSLSLSLSVLLLDTLLAPLVIPVTLRLLVGSVVKLDAWSMMADLMVMVALPALAAMALYQTTHGQIAKTAKPRLEPFSKLALLLIITANATGCAPFLRSINVTLVLVMACTLILCLLGYFLGYWAGRAQKQPFPTTLTIAINSGMRNISAGAVLAAQYFPADVMFPVAFSPIFLQVSAAFVVRVMLNTKPGKAYTASTAPNN